MKKIFLLGFLASLFFSITFAINSWLNIEQAGHWYWTATLRYVFVFLFLSLFIWLRYGQAQLIETGKCFITNYKFWILAGGIGFGLFYLALCYAASFSEGWVLASTWQCTILFTPLVIYILGDKVKLKGVVYLFVIFIGVILINSYAFAKINVFFLQSVVPILFAAFCYPLGNTLCKYACEGKYKKLTIHKYSVATNTFSQILMMVLGAIPVLLITGIIIRPIAPTTSQIQYVLIVAITTGVIATSLLYKARSLAGTNRTYLAFADGLQAFEVPFVLFWEVILFNTTLPNLVGKLGLLILFVGTVLFYTYNLNQNPTPAHK